MAAIHAAPTQGLRKAATLFDLYRPKAGNASDLHAGRKKPGRALDAQQ
jgi:phenylalanyl-tRNA synthetase beta chain